MMSFISMNFIFIALNLLLTAVTVTVHSSKRRIKNPRFRQLWLKTVPSILCISPGDYTRKEVTETEVKSEVKQPSSEVGDTDQKAQSL